MATHSCFVHLMGGLGNQLFEIAAGYAHARKSGRVLQLADRPSCHRPAYWTTFLHKLADKVVKTPPTGIRLWREPHFHYTEIPGSATGIYGYFQSSRYFADVSGEIRDLFEPHPIIKAVTSEKYEDLLTKEGRANSCVIHIRRTDYLTGSNYEFHVVCDKAWYRRALAEMDRQRAGQPTRYLVFSDDLDWCRAAEQKDLWSGRDVVFVNERNDCVALHLMSQFQTYVISNSSFSWWAVWLSAAITKTVIAPDRWFGPTGPQDWQDIYEPGWIRVA